VLICWNIDSRYSCHKFSLYPSFYIIFLAIFSIKISKKIKFEKPAILLRRPLNVNIISPAFACVGAPYRSPEQRHGA
jgi:hypothetical protein